MAQRPRLWTPKQKGSDRWWPQSDALRVWWGSARLDRLPYKNTERVVQSSALLFIKEANGGLLARGGRRERHRYAAGIGRMKIFESHSMSPIWDTAPRPDSAPLEWAKKSFIWPRRPIKKTETLTTATKNSPTAAGRWRAPIRTSRGPATAFHDDDGDDDETAAPINVTLSQPLAYISAYTRT